MTERPRQRLLVCRFLGPSGALQRTSVHGGEADVPWEVRVLPSLTQSSPSNASGALRSSNGGQ